MESSMTTNTSYGRPLDEGIIIFSPQEDTSITNKKNIRFLNKLFFNALIF
jgi:hypothetical protein